ncbi:MAG: NAD(P)/FAD-dependent oxidoreductase [Woeseiaceae bacterium]
MQSSIGIIGAGIVGVTTALELRDRGFDVLLIDRNAPGLETSYGNAGVITGATVLNVNNPGIWRQMPRLLFNRSAYFRFDAPFMLANWRWMLAFLRYSRPRNVLPTARALCALQGASLDRHKSLIARAGSGSLLVENGWLKVFRTETGFRASARERALMSRLQVPFSMLSADDLGKLEPALKPVYRGGLLMRDSCSVRDPYALTQAYLSLFAAQGGVVVRGDVGGIRQSAGTSWLVEFDGSGQQRVDHLVIAAGPWAPEVCGMLGYRIPMAWERGYHTHLETPDPELTRPVFDVERGFVMSPQQSSVRITSGVEFTHRDARPDYTLIRAAVRAARTAAEFGNELETTPWLGSRPTLPDSLPMIGEAPRHRRLWFNFGHQHIGLSASAGSAGLIGDQIEGKVHAHINGGPFAPGRFNI